MEPRPPENNSCGLVGLRRLVHTLRAGQNELDQLDQLQNLRKTLQKTELGQLGQLGQLDQRFFSVGETLFRK
jgi:hypothetical protein